MGVAGERLGHGSNAARPGVSDEAPFGAEPIAGIAGIADIALYHQRFAFVGIEAIDLVVAAAR